MAYNIIAVPSFNKEVKKLNKKYPSLKSELEVLFDQLEIEPKQGVALGSNCYKIRIAITSKGKGKSGGARLITNIVVSKSSIYLLTIFEKSEKDNLTDKELAELLRKVGFFDRLV